MLGLCGGTETVPLENRAKTFSDGGEDEDRIMAVLAWENANTDKDYRTCLFWTDISMACHCLWQQTFPSPANVLQRA